MRASALLLSLATLGAAYRVPEGQGEGLYRAYINERGVEVHERLTPGMLRATKRKAESSTPPAVIRDLAGKPGTSPNPAVAERGNGWYTFCGCGIGLDHGSCDDAVADLKNQIANQGGWVPIDPLASYYSIRGNVVAFACNKSNWYASAAVVDITNGLQEVTNSCGWYIAGTGRWELPSSNGAYASASIGYMLTGQDFCGNAERSGAATC